MIDNSRKPNLAGDLVRIHKVITRGLTVGGTRGKEFLKDGFPDRNAQQGFADYVRSLVTILSAHHLSEDEIAFPVLKKRLPSVPYERLAEDHKKIEVDLDPVKQVLYDGAKANTASWLNVVVDVMGKTEAVWTPHINVEELFFSEHALAEVMVPAEQVEVSNLISKHAQEHAGPPFLVLPFVLFNLTDADRAEMVETFPKVAIDTLNAKEWKELRAPMKSFLLE